MGEVRYRVHALQQMIERGITRAAVLEAVASGEAIERSHRIGRPLPTRLVLGWSGDRPLHILIADDVAGAHYVITVYEPSTDRWEADFRTRKERR
ncbi:MAG: DUF4258 domain-containing protein [Egibacteraceae bacterium]